MHPFSTPRPAFAPLAAAVLAVGLLASAPDTATAQEIGPSLVANGGFESGDFSGWTAGSLTALSGVEGAAAHSGAFGAFSGENSFIRQALTTVTGPTYSLRFWLRSDGLDPDPFYVNWNGAKVFDSVQLGAFEYREFVVGGLTAAGPVTLLTLGFRGDLGFVEVDDVSVRVAAIPEPQTWALMAGGMAVLAAWQRRRRAPGP